VVQLSAPAERPKRDLVVALEPKRRELRNLASEHESGTTQTRARVSDDDEAEMIKKVRESFEKNKPKSRETRPAA